MKLTQRILSFLPQQGRALFDKLKAHEPLSPALRAEQRKVLLARAQVLCWLGFIVYPITILKILQTNYKTNLHIHRTYQLKTKVQCRLNQLNQVFLNLLVNALQAIAQHQQGNLWIETTQRGESAVITIRDDGPGIAENIQAKIFESYFTTKQKNKGSGLGLYICRQIMKELGGQLSMKSTVGAGTQFMITLPINFHKVNILSS